MKKKTMTKFQKNLFLLSLLFLLCGRVVGDRGGTFQHRSVAVAERETTAPTLATTIDSGKGMKSEKLSKSNLGKGMKNGKSLKSEKKFGQNLSMTLGKGTKQEKDVKFMKSRKVGKSIKFGKLLKKEKRKIHQTVPPTSADSISSKSSLFAITYSQTKEVPTTEDLQELTLLTEKYLQDFMMNFFEKTALTDLENFLTIMKRDVFVAGEPILAEYQSNGLFNPDSIFIPVTRELDNLIEDAIAQDEYLDMLKTLPRSNPFRATRTIAFTEVDNQANNGENTSSRSENSSFVRAGVAAAAAGVVVLAASLAMIKKRRSSTDDDFNDTESFSARNSTGKDLMITGESCSKAVDEASSNFAHWRTAKSYNNGLEGGEFEDEPLDS